MRRKWSQELPERELRGNVREAAVCGKFCVAASRGGVGTGSSRGHWHRRGIRRDAAVLVVTGIDVLHPKRHK